MSGFSWGTSVTNKTGGSFEVAPEGNHAAICVGLIDLGTHTDEYQGAISENRKVAFVWELANETNSDGERFLVAERYNVPEKFYPSSKLRQLLESWRGRPYQEGESPNWGGVLGAACLVNVIHDQVGKKQRTIAKVENVTPLPKGFAVPPPSRQPYGYKLEMGPFQGPSWLPWVYGQPIASILAQCKEHDPSGLRRQFAAAAAADHAQSIGPNIDDIPF